MLVGQEECRRRFWPDMEAYCFIKKTLGAYHLYVVDCTCLLCPYKASATDIIDVPLASEGYIH
jgi:hypothetical protein